MAWPALLAAALAPVIGGGMSMIGGGMSLAGGMLHAGSTAVGLGAKGIGAIGSAAGGLMPGGGTDREIQGGQQQGQPDINGKYFNEKSGRWHDRNKNNRFTTPPAQFGAQGMSGGSSLAAGGVAAGGGQQMEMDFGGTGSMNEPEAVGPFGMLIGLLAGMANDISAIKGLTSGILSTMVANEAEDDQQDAQMSLFNEEQLAQGEETQRKAQDLMDKGEREGSLTDTGDNNKKEQGLLGKAFGPIKSGWNKILNQPNWLKALGLGGLLWWLSTNKEGFVKGLTVVLEWVQDLTKKFKNADFEDFTIKGFAANLAESIGGLFTSIKESDTFKNLVSTVWPALRDFIQDFTEGMFSMIWEVSKEMLFGASGDRAIRGFAKTGISEIETLSGIQKEVGKPLTDKTVEAMAGDDPNKERIDVAKLKLWNQMREITNESKGRVQWKGIATSGTSAMDPSGMLVGYGLSINPEAHGVDIGTLMATVPIIDGVESKWEDLKNVKMAAVIGKDATEEQGKQIVNNLAEMSALAAESTELEMKKQTGDFGMVPFGTNLMAKFSGMSKEEAGTKYINNLIEENKIKQEKLLQESKELGMSDISAISAGIAVKPSLKSGTTTATSIEGTTSKDEFEGGGGFKYVNGKLVRVPTLLDTVLPSISTSSSLRAGIEKDWVNRSQGWDPNKLFKGTLSDWQKVRANTIQMGPWDGTAAGKAHWEHMIRVDNMKIIGLSGRSDAHRKANLADPVGYALADLAGSGALDEFVHGTKAANGEAQSIPSSYVGMSTKMLENLTSNQLAEYQRASGTGSPVIFSEGNKTNVNSNIVNTANIQAANDEWTQKALLSYSVGINWNQGRGIIGF